MLGCSGQGPGKGLPHSLPQQREPDHSSVSTGNVVNIQTGHWVGKQSGLGAGLDSFYEYLLKSYILFGEKEDLDMFNAAYHSIQSYLRRGYSRRTAPSGALGGQTAGWRGGSRQLGPLVGGFPRGARPCAFATCSRWRAGTAPAGGH